MRFRHEAENGISLSHNSCNARFRTLAWGMKRLAKIEKTIEARLKKEAKRYNKSYPGEMLHLDAPSHLAGQVKACVCLIDGLGLRQSPVAVLRRKFG